MTDFAAEKSHSDQLADHLAGLQKQLRLGACPPVDLARPLRSLLSLKMAGLLLGGVAEAAQDRSLGRFSAALTDFMEFLTENPGACPPHLEPVLDRLLGFLEGLLHKADEGIPHAELTRDPGWELMLSSFRQAGTPLAVCDDIEHLLQRWADQWLGQPMASDQEIQLRQRWRNVRRSADALLDRTVALSSTRIGQPATTRPARPRADKGEFLLLIAGVLRREQIRQKLLTSGFYVDIARDVDEATELCAAGAIPTALICDNLEPSNHLREIRARLTETLPERLPPLVLIATGSGPARHLERRAAALGARGVWAEPFQVEDLARFLPP
jgi:CheY-like chemotaxis protein